MKHKKPAYSIMLVLFIVIGIMAFKISVDHAIDLVEVPYALVDIKPRQAITSNMIGIKKIPKAYLDDNSYQKKQQILNQYTDINGMIPKGSLFYKKMLHHKDDLPDYPSMQLKEGQTAFSLASDLVKLSGNTIVAGQKVDVYVTIQQQREQPMVDRLVKGVRVLAIKDRNGLDMDDPQAAKVPYVVILGVRDEIIPYLKVANKIGMIDIYAQTVKGKGPESEFITDSKVIPYLKHA